MNFDLNTIQDCLKETIIYSKLTNVKLILLKDCEVYNIETISFELFLTDEWIYYYFIPTKKYNENLLLLGYINDLKNIKVINEILKPKITYIDIKHIAHIFSTELTLTPINYKYHSLKYRNQIYFSDYLDIICCGWIAWLPPHWGTFSKKQSPSNTNYITNKYCLFLEEYELNDSLESAIIFYNSNILK